MDRAEIARQRKVFCFNEESVSHLLIVDPEAVYWETIQSSAKDALAARLVADEEPATVLVDSPRILLSELESVVSDGGAETLTIAYATHGTVARKTFASLPDAARADVIPAFQQCDPSLTLTTTTSKSLGDLGPVYIQMGFVGFGMAIATWFAWYATVAPPTPDEAPRRARDRLFLEIVTTLGPVNTAVVGLLITLLPLAWHVGRACLFPGKVETLARTGSSA